MGYNAFVRCNCFEEGKTTTPPYKDFVRMGDESLFIDLESLYEQDKEEYFRRDREFDNWKKSACPHKDMELVNERLANISGMAAFRTILRESGGEARFPILVRHLPVSNGGALPAVFSATALEELLDLEQEKANEEKIVLKVKATGQRIQSTNVNHPDIFTWTGYNKLNYGIDKDGFFIVRNSKWLWAKKSELVFRSRDFRQQRIGKDQYCFTDNLSEARFIASASILPDGKEESSEDFEFIVVKEKMTVASEYSYIIEPLKKLAKASIASGNPIIWT